MSEPHTASGNRVNNLSYAWALAPGDIIFYSHCDVLTSFGSLKTPQYVAKEILAKQWQVTNRGKLLATLEWLKCEGDSQEFRNLLPSGDGNGFINKYAKVIGNDALIAWDLGRFCALVRWGEYVGFLSLKESCRFLLEAATALQAQYESWESYFEHFLIGRRFRKNSLTTIDEDKAEKFLLHNSTSHWQKLDWFMSLTKLEVPENASQASPYYVDLSGSLQDVLEKKDQYLARWLSADTGNTQLLYTYAKFKWLERRDAAGAAQVFEQAIASTHNPVEMYEQYAWLLESEMNEPIRAHEMYRAAADLDSAMGKTALGNFYAQGIGVDKNVEQALLYYQAAADQEYAHAQFMLGLLHQSGDGIVPNFKQANVYFMQAAKNNFSDAMLYLGYNYEHGQGFPKNLDKAITWYRRAADLQNPVAQYNLGIFYQLGNGVERDDNKAFFFFQQAAEHGYTTAMYQTGWCWHFGRGTHTDYGHAMHWYQRAAERGNHKALTHIGVLHHDGLGVPKDAERARDCYLKATDASDFAKFQLGRLYYECEAYEEAWPWVEKAARAGVAGGQRLAGIFRLKGHPPVIKNAKKAFKWFERAARKNDSVAQYELAEMYDNRVGVMQRNQSKAEYWYERAAVLGNADAQFSLGWYYENGEMEKPNLVEAYAWYMLASEQGEVRAQKKVEELQDLLTDFQLKKAMHTVKELRAAAAEELAASYGDKPDNK